MKESDFKKIEEHGNIVDDSPGDYYVTVRDAGRVGFLLGPYPKHHQAIALIERAREIANKKDPCSHFYYFGTARLEQGSGKKGILNRFLNEFPYKIENWPAPAGLGQARPPRL